MMSLGKVAIIADIHSNLEALQVVLKEIERLNPDKVICLGDIIGYGANPNECCELVKKYCDVVLLGNHDAAVAGIIRDDYFVEHARVAVEWTKKILKDEYIEWIKSLPLTYELDGFFFSHGAPYSPDSFIYLVSSDAVLWSLKFLSASGFKASFSGHAHITYSFGVKKGESGILYGEFEEINFDDFEVVAINVGSVGQPRDRNPKSAFGLIEEGKIYRVFRVEYDISKAAQKILDAGLPSILSSRLFLGR
jgi:diadenosine tetraphosphatase ApaH/serine/threonine PP2A family protein phosphatase